MEICVPLVDLDYGEEEEKAVLDVIRTHCLTMGSITQEFEHEFANYVGAKHAIAVSNVTEALHLACLALGVGSSPQDEVILPSLTFVGTANAVLYTGAQVRFADVLGLRELNISPEEIEKRITSNTKAIIVTHYGGYACWMPEILEIASFLGLAVIEDAAHATGARLGHRNLGTWGDIGCFSFLSDKNLSMGEGGMLVTNKDEVAEKLHLLRSHGMSRLAAERYQLHANPYDVVALGYNYGIDEIRSALGLAQLKKLDANNTRRQEITGRYWKGLNDWCKFGVVFPFQQALGQSSYYLFPMLLPKNIDRRIFTERMQRAGVQTSIHYPAIHCFSYYQKRYPGLYLPLTEQVSSREITLPLYPTMQDKDIELVISAVHEALAYTL